MIPAIPVLVVLGVLCTLLGTFGGIGGATLLVPVLIALGVEPLVAAPLGMAAVAAGSLAAAPRQLGEGLVHHRLGLSVELTASVGTVAGALVATSVSEAWLARILGLAALLGAVGSLSRKGMRNLPVPAFEGEQAGGEWPGTLGGQYFIIGRAVPYQAHRVPLGLALSVIAGTVAGLSGVGGGFVKTPTMSEVMRVPIKVATATTTFTLGLTASTALLIYAVQGRVETHSAAGIVLGALLGGLLGTRLQTYMPAVAVRRATGVLLLVVAVVVIWRSFP